MKHIKMMVAAGVAALGLAGGASAQSYNLTLCGASPGGLWSLLGAGIDAAMKEAFPGSTVTYQTSGGGFANVALLDQGKCDLAIIHDAEINAAVKGLKPFQGPMDSMRSVAVLYTWAPMQLIMNADYAEENGIETIADIAEKQLPINILLNRKGNVVSDIGASLLTAAGASPEKIEEWGGSVTYAASAEQGDLMRDRRADALLNSLFVGHSSIRQLADAIDVVQIPMTDDAAQKVIEEWNISDFTIPNAAYEWTDADVPTVTVSAQLFARQDADDQMVQDVTTALLEHADKVAGVHKAMAELTPELMAEGKAIEYHPAAEKVYKEKGLH